MDEKTTEEEASLRHEDESSFLDSSERSDNNNDNDDKTGAKDNTCYGNGNGNGNGNGRGDSNSSNGGSEEWMEFLIPSILLETFGSMEKVEASRSTKSRKNLKLGKSKNKIARTVKAAKKLVKNLSITSGRQKR